jgi:hypothetical protein
LVFLRFVHVVRAPHDIHYDNMHAELRDHDTSISNDKFVQNCDDLTEPTPSTSSVSCQVSSDVQSGSEFLENTLLGCHSSGLVASPFIDSVKNNSSKLQHLLSLHGIVSHGLSADGCRIELLRHLFSGLCVSNECSSRDRTGCSMFSRGFESAAQMSSGAFNILSSAAPSQRSDDELLRLLQDLEISTNFRPKKLRPQIERELKRQAKCFFSLKNLSITEDVFFLGFERHSRAMLLAFASAHGINRVVHSWHFWAIFLFIFGPFS